MDSLTELDERILAFAERREQNPQLPLGEVVAEFGISPTRYTQILMHLVQRKDVAGDPRWAMMAHRIQRVMDGRARARAGRLFRVSA
jgi:hypothetical protein